MLTKSEIETIAANCFEDPLEFFKTFLPHWFPGPVPWFHRGIIAILLRKTDFLLKYGELNKIVKHFVYKLRPNDPDSPELPIFRLEVDGTISMVVSPYTLIMMPRGYAKTTIMNACALFCALYQEFYFQMYLSETATHAENQLGNVKKEIETNEAITAVFGDLVPGRQESAKWTSDQLEPKNKTVLMARGRGGQVRGSNVGAKRPDRIMVDDVEDEESVQTPEQLEKTRKWFYEAVLPALAEMNPKANIVAFGTLLHKDALLMQLARDEQWTVIKLGAVDKDGDPLWPELMSLEKLELKKRSFANVGNLAGYYREYFNELRNEDSQKFKDKYITILVPKDPIVLKAIAMDPAIKSTKVAKGKLPDFHAQAVTGMTERGNIVVLAADGQRGLSPRDQVDWYFEWIIKHGLQSCDKYGIESVAYQAALVHLVREEMFRKKKYFEITPITHSSEKIARVEGILQPRYAAGYITHAAHFPLLREQLLDWPNGKLDVPDALAMSVGLLDPAAPMAGNDEGRNIEDDEYAPLSRELGNWRSAP